MIATAILRAPKIKIGDDGKLLNGIENVLNSTITSYLMKRSVINTHFSERLLIDFLSFLKNK